MVYIDMDGVVADFVGATIDRLNTLYGTNYISEDVDDYYFFECLPHDISFIKEKGFFENLNTYPGAVDFIKKVDLLTDDWYFLTSVTKDHLYAFGEKMRWVEKTFGVDSRKVVICNDKASFIGIDDFLIDDRYKTIRDARKKGKERAYLCERSYTLKNKEEYTLVNLDIFYNVVRSELTR